MSDELIAKYGPWALIVGASEGVGAEFARTMASHGVNVALLSRRQPVLDELAAEIGAEHGVETRTIAVDLTSAGAAASIVAATSGLEVGMLMYCAGADPHYEPFLANSVEVPLALVQRNCIVSMELCHHFAGPMVERGRGGIILVSSGAGLIGMPNMVAYGASKAFDIVMAEALWAELHDKGVDVLSLVLSMTDTPAFRRILVKQGVLTDPDDPLPFDGVATPEQVVAEALEHLADGPTWLAAEQLRQMQQHLGSMTRRDAARSMVQQAGGVMDADRDTEPPT